MFQNIDPEVKKNNETRLRRASLWMHRARHSLVDRHAKFIYYWLSFEAAYGKFFVESYTPYRSGKNELETFIRKITKGNEEEFRQLLQSRCLQSAHKIVNLSQTDKFFWEKPKNPNPEEWRKCFERDKKQVDQCDDITAVLIIIFNRLRTVRHQIFHGASSLYQGHGRTQVYHGAKILETFIPIFIEKLGKKMKQNPNVWGNVPYPRVGKPDEENLLPLWAKDN